MQLCNLMTLNGFEKEIFGSGSVAWLGMVILFFVVVFSKKWLGEEFQMPFSTMYAWIGAYVPYIIVVTISCSPKWAMAAGLVGFIVGALVLPMFIETDMGGG